MHCTVLYLQVQIVVVDTLSGSTTVFGETNNFPTRMVLIYDGIHYDALYDTREDGSEVTVHSVNDERYIIHTGCAGIIHSKCTLLLPL